MSNKLGQETKIEDPRINKAIESLAVLTANSQAALTQAKDANDRYIGLLEKCVSKLDELLKGKKP